MIYKVVVAFKDMQDFNHQYFVGDTFPREGTVVSNARIAELASANNRAKMVLIKGIEEEKPVVVEPVIEQPEVVEDKEYNFSRSEVNKMSTSKLKSLAEELGLDAELSGAKLKPLIIEKLGL